VGIAAGWQGRCRGGGRDAGISDGLMTEITGGDLQVGMLVITDQKAAVK